MMSTVRVREKRQITLPAQASKLLGIAENDVLDVEITASAIVLRPIGGNITTRTSRLMQYAGAGQALNADPDETIRAIRDDRDAWK